MYSIAASRIASSSRHFTSPPSARRTNLSRTCMAVKAIFQSIDSSRSSPTPRLSSDTKAISRDSETAGALSRKRSPRTRTFPPAVNKPIIPLAMPSLPCPASPPMPNISPFFTEKVTLRTVSPGISTHRFSTSSTVSVSAASLTRADAAPTLRPTMVLAILKTSVSEARVSCVTLPSRNTTILSHRSMTSWSLCDMNIIEMPRADRFRSALTRVSASDSARTAVGSSRIRSFVFFRSTSRAISVNCLCPTGISDASVSGSIANPIVSMAASARRLMACRSNIRILSPNISTSGLYFVGSLLSIIFSVTVKPGSRENSWCTMPIPASIASKGD